jgi:tRNA-dihydrouridine synthase 1
VRKLYENLKVPVFCKIRLLPSLDDTLQLARMLQDAGCQLLAVHGRTRDNKGLYCTPADWDSIRIVKCVQCLSYPFIWGLSVMISLRERGCQGRRWLFP